MAIRLTPVGRRFVPLLAVVSLFSIGPVVELAAGGAGQFRTAGLLGLDASSGETRWQIAPRRRQFYAGPGLGRQILAVTDAECVRAEEPRSRLVGLDPDSGERLWSVAPELGGVANKTMFWSRTATVDVAASGVIVTGGGRLGSGRSGLDPKSGKTLWTLAGGELGVSATLVFNMDRSTEGRDVLAAFDRRSGKAQWTFPHQADDDWGPTFDVVAATRDSVVVANGGYLGRVDDDPFGPTTFFVLDAATGVERSRFESADPNISSDYLFTGDSLVYPEGSSLVARDVRSGSVVWQTPIPGGGLVEMRVTGDQHEVAALTDRNAFVVLDARSGTQRWASKPTQSFLGASPKVIIMRAFKGPTGRPSHATRPGGLVAVRTRDGKKLWRRKLGPPVASRGDESVSVGIAHGLAIVAGVCESG